MLRRFGERERRAAGRTQLVPPGVMDGWMEDDDSIASWPLFLGEEVLGRAQGLLPRMILLRGNRGLDAHINLSLHLRSEEGSPFEGTNERTSCGRREGKERATEEAERKGAWSPQDVSSERQWPPPIVSTAVSPRPTQRRGESPPERSVWA